MNRNPFADENPYMATLATSAPVQPAPKSSWRRKYLRPIAQMGIVLTIAAMVCVLGLALAEGADRGKLPIDWRLGRYICLAGLAIIALSPPITIIRLLYAVSRG